MQNQSVSRAISMLIGAILAYIACFFPSIVAADYYDVGSHNRVMIAFAGLLGLSLFFFRRQTKFNWPSGVIPFLLFYFYSQLHDVFFISYFGMSIGDQCIRFYLLYSIWILAVFDFKSMRSQLWIAYLFIMLILLIYFYIMNEHLAFGFYADRLHPEASGLDVNANTISWLSVLLIVLGVRLHEMATHVSALYVRKLVLISYVVPIFVTISNQTISAFLVSIFFITWSVFLKINRIFFLIALMIVSMASLLFFCGIGSEITDTFLGSIISRIEKGGSIEERAYLMQVALESFMKSPWFGNSYDDIITSQGMNHTFWINIIAVLGLCGFFMFIVFFISIFVKGIQNATSGTLMARLFLVSYLTVAPPYLFLSIALLIIFSDRQNA